MQGRFIIDLSNILEIKCILNKNVACLSVEDIVCTVFWHDSCFPGNQPDVERTQVNLSTPFTKCFAAFPTCWGRHLFHTLLFQEYSACDNTAGCLHCPDGALHYTNQGTSRYQMRSHLCLPTFLTLVLKSLHHSLSAV